MQGGPPAGHCPCRHRKWDQDSGFKQCHKCPSSRVDREQGVSSYTDTTHKADGLISCIMTRQLLAKGDGRVWGVQIKGDREEERAWTPVAGGDG